MTEKTRVLVVDDNQDLLETFAMILRRRGFNVDTAPDGLRAVDKFRAQPFDVILMDVVMPEMNGVEAFRRIRQLSPAARVILMTAYSEDELIRMALDEGALRVVYKPIKIDKMIELISQTATNRMVLVVDDDADIRQTMTKTLELEGYQVLAASSGEEAIATVRERNCQMAFIDIKLPLMNGLETYLRLKEINPAITVIMMTGYRDEVKDIVEKALAASAVTCLYKPFAPVEAVNLVSRLGSRPNYAGSGYDGQREYFGS